LGGEPREAGGNTAVGDKGASGNRPEISADAIAVAAVVGVTVGAIAAAVGLFRSATGMSWGRSLTSSSESESDS
jgi:hypothetical protein